MEAQDFRIRISGFGLPPVTTSAVCHVLECRCKKMERKKRTVISLQYQPRLDFEEAEQFPPFAFPEYQRDLLVRRIAAAATDFGVVASVYFMFVLATYLQMPPGAYLWDKRIAGIYLVGYLLLVAIYFLLFMLSASQTPGMKTRKLVVVSRKGTPLDPRESCLRGFGYFISIVPLMLGFIWALIDPEHLTWADKVSGTFVKRA
jgi:uncharacterized RDD family membrane protein YckC